MMVCRKTTGFHWVQRVSLCLLLLACQTFPASANTSSELEDLWVSLMARCISYTVGEGIELQDAETFEKKPETADQPVRQSATFKHGIRLRYGRSEAKPDHYSRNCGFSLPLGVEKETLDALHDVTMEFYDGLEEQSWTPGFPTKDGAPLLRKGIWIDVVENCKALAGITIIWEDSEVGFAALLNGSACSAALVDK